MGSYSILAGQRKIRLTGVKGLEASLPSLINLCLNNVGTYIPTSKLYSRVYPGAWTGRSRHRRISAVLQDISDRGIKSWQVFPVRSINLDRWKSYCGEQPAAKFCRAKQQHSTHLGKTDGKADECLKLWGSEPARNKLFPCRKVPGEVVKFCSVILNQKSQCLLILAQLQQNHHNSFLCGLRWKNSRSKWFSVQIQFSTLSKRQSGGATHFQSIPVCLMVRGKVLIALWILTSILSVLCCTYHCANHYIIAPYSLSSFTGMSRWVTAWFLVRKDPSLQKQSCACAFTEEKRPVAD